AEDGIRDRNVTGVQTCALPISTAAEGLSAPPAKIGISCSNWNSFFNFSFKKPICAVDSTKGGQILGSIWKVFKISGLQVFSSISSNKVPAASEYSICIFPVKR